MLASQKILKLTEDYNNIIENINVGINLLTEVALESHAFNLENNIQPTKAFDAIVLTQCLIKQTMKHEQQTLNSIRVHDSYDTSVKTQFLDAKLAYQKIKQKDQLRGCQEWTSYKQQTNQILPEQPNNNNDSNGEDDDEEEEDIIMGTQSVVLVCPITQLTMDTAYTSSKCGHNYSSGKQLLTLNIELS